MPNAFIQTFKNSLQFDENSTFGAWLKKIANVKNSTKDLTITREFSPIRIALDNRGNYQVIAEAKMEGLKLPNRIILGARAAGIDQQLKQSAVLTAELETKLKE